MATGSREKRAAHDLPGPLRLASAFPFVGRGDELEALQELTYWDGEGRRVVLVGGAPGSGKTRLAREFAGGAAAAGCTVLYGACDAMIRTPYGPFAEALEGLARRVEPSELREALGTGGGELIRLVPDLPSRVGPLPDPIRGDPDTERHRLHTAVMETLGAISRRRPIVVVLEDLHWADAPTLLLVRHITRAVGDARVLVIGTYRDTEADVPEALAETLAALRRSEAVAWLRLGGLSAAEVGELVRGAAGAAPETELSGLAETITGLTGGNAFLVCELWRTLVETEVVTVEGDALRLSAPLTELGTPESVREVVSERLTRLEPRTNDVLALAAAAGTEFELGTVRGAAGLRDAELAGALDEAVASGMIEELPSRSLSYRFGHELMRRALYDRLSGLRRAELHLRIGEALEAREDRSARTLADLAHHFAAAAPLGEAERGFSYNLQAAGAATAALDFEEAAERLRTALALPVGDPERRAEALLELGTVCHRGGKALDALDAFGQAAEIARDLDDAALLVRAAIGYEDACWRPGITERGAAELLEEAAAALGTEVSELRVGLLGGLARALAFRGDYERGAAVRDSAIAMAREIDDRSGLATVLMRSYWSRGTSSLAEILEMLTEARDLGAELGDTEIQAEAIAWRVPTFVALNDMDSARQEVAALLLTAEETAQPFMLHVAEHYGSAIALSDGRLEDAEAMARRSDEWSRLLTGRDESGVHGIQMFSIRREQGRLAEVAPVVALMAGDTRRGGPWQPGLIALLAEVGMEDEARERLQRLARDGLGHFRESLWLGSLAYLADAATALADEEVAGLVYPELEPLGGTNVMIGHLVATYGAADRYLGMLATTLGEWGTAERHFERALELNRRMEANTWLAHTAYQYARLLLSRPERNPERADELLGEAADLARGIGMPALLERIERLAAPPPAKTLPDDLTPREAQVLGLVARGMSNREIGRALQISEHTAANHIRSILGKTRSSNRTEAAAYAHRHGLAPD